jgi:hypothetical protein
MSDTTRQSSPWKAPEENSINTAEEEYCVLISFGLTYLRLAIRRLLYDETERYEPVSNTGIQLGALGLTSMTLRGWQTCVNISGIYRERPGL